MVVVLNFWSCPYLTYLPAIPTITSTCVGNSLPRHCFVGEKKGRLNRMSPTCWANILDMTATDTNVCLLGGVDDRHKSWSHVRNSFWRGSANILYMFATDTNVRFRGCRWQTQIPALPAKNKMYPPPPQNVGRLIYEYVDHLRYSLKLNQKIL